MNRRELNGISISSGTAIATPIIIKQHEVAFSSEEVEDVEKEIDKFVLACKKTISELEKLITKTKNTIGEAESNIFSVHAAILNDQYSFVEPVKEQIRNEKKNAASAVTHQLSMIEETMNNSADQLFRERAADIRDIRNQLLEKMIQPDSMEIPSDKAYIVVAHELTPSMTMKMDFRYVKGIITEIGGATSHAAIIAKSMGIPGIAGINNATEIIQTEDPIILDARKGIVIIDPAENEIEHTKQIIDLQEKERNELKEFINKESRTKDGRKISINANISTGKDMNGVIEVGADGIGLFRSEFLFLDRNSLPTEEEQFQEYKQVLTQMGTKKVIVRTLDVGGDKLSNVIHIEKESNPFLGLRAIRLCLKRKELFRTQLRALVRASKYGNLAIMFPMISSIDELMEAKHELNNVINELEEEGIITNKKIQIGMMIEIPSTAILAEVFAKEVDFFSIGTNDLTQYTLAVDRGNESVSELYTTYHPAILRLILDVAKAAHREGIKCGICGEAGGDLNLLPMWVGIGIDELSMTSKTVLKIRKALSNLDSKECEKVPDIIGTAKSAKEVKKMLERR